MTSVVLIATCLALCAETVQAQPPTTTTINISNATTSTTSTNTTSTVITTTTTTNTTTTTTTTTTNATTTTITTTTTTNATTQPVTTTPKKTNTSSVANNNNNPSTTSNTSQPSPSPTPALTEAKDGTKNKVSQELTVTSLPANSADFLKGYLDNLAEATNVPKDKMNNAKIDSMKISVTAVFTQTISVDHAKTGFATAASVPESDVAIKITRRLKGSQDSDDYALDASSAREYMTFDDYANVEEKRRASSGLRQRVPESDVKIVVGRRASAALRQLATKMEATITVKEVGGKDIVQAAKAIHTAVNNPANIAAKIGAASNTTVTAPTIETKIVVSVSTDVYSKKALPSMESINTKMATKMNATVTGTVTAGTTGSVDGTSSRAFSGRIHVAFVASVLLTLTSRLGL